MRKLVMTGVLCTAMLAVVSLAAPTNVTVSINPKTLYIVPGGDRWFSAAVSGATNTSVTWSATGGTINISGKFTAPAAVPVGTTYTVTATSGADPAASANCTVIISNPPAYLGWTSPASLKTGNFTLQVFGSSFMNGATVYFNGQALPTTFKSTTNLSSSGSVSSPGTYNVQVQNPYPSAMSQLLTVTVGSSNGGGNPPPPPSAPISLNVTPGSVALQPGGSQQFTAVVNNSANQTVNWSVNGKPGGDSSAGLIDLNGLYTAPGLLPSPNVVTVAATAAANGSSTATATVTIKNPQAVTWGRLLDQMSFGAKASDMAHAQQIGVDAFIDEQFGLPESPLPPNSADRSAAMNAFWNNAYSGQDQLRQRTIYALSEIIVISLNKNVNGDMVMPWLKILSKDAFGNYKQLLKDITLDGGMGHYLDLANSGGGGAPNENYPREVMQLFSIGLVQLNQDGSIRIDPSTNQPLPTYSQADVVGLAKALTGWTWNSPNGTIGGGGNNSYYPGPMLPMPGRHSAGSKTFLGHTIPAGGSIQSDFDAAIDILFSHPNVAPFIATRLIRALVTSNPSPAYIEAVADVFTNTNGDMKAVITAILENPEARNDIPQSTHGRLRSLEQFLIAFARQMNMGLTNPSDFNYLLESMNEGVLDAPSVFGHYSPLFKIPKSGGLFGPEFQIYSASDAANRANFVYQMLYVYPSNPQIQSFINLAGNPQALIDAVDNALLFGRMSQTLRNAIFNSLSAMPDNNQRAINAIYLTALSGEFLVQH